MGAHSVGRMERYWRQVQDWWEEYFTDNPIAWLLHRQIGLSGSHSFSSELQSIQQQMGQALKAQDWEAVQSLQEARSRYLRGLLTPKPFWKRWDIWWAILLWCAVLLTAIILYLRGWWEQIAQGLSAPQLWFAFTLFLMLVPFTYGSTLRSLILYERLHGTDIFLWLTRLTGRHIMGGAITTLVFQHQLRPYWVFIAPIVWLIGTVIGSSVWRGVWLTVAIGWLFTTFALLWMVISVFALPASSRSLQNVLLYALHLCIIFATMAGCFLFIVSNSSSDFLALFEEVDLTPVWAWWRLSVVWYSLFPPVGIVSMLFVEHPFWGIPQGLVYLGLALLLMPSAVKFAERARLRREPEPPLEEGMW